MCEDSKSEKRGSRSLWRILHEDQRGAVSLETVLIIAAVALPILIFILKYGWPRIQEFFKSALDDLEEGAEEAKGGGF